MIIGIDASRAINEKAGIARYCRSLLENLGKIDQKNIYKLLFTFIRSQSDKKREAKIISSFFKKSITKIVPIPGSWKENLWGSHLPIISSLMGKVDVWHATSFFEASLGDNISQIVTIYDMTTFLFPKHRGKEVSKRLSERTVSIAQKAARIITISESSKKDILRLIPNLTENNIKVIYPAADEIFKPEKIKKQDFILSVGTVEPRKNLKRLIKAYRLLPEKIGNKYKLIIVGASGWNNSDIYNEAKDFVDSGKIIFKNYVEDKELAKLYNQAQIFVYPSLYEGFGLPVLESLKCGLPVITSNISSLPEVSGKSAIYVNPYNEKEMAEAIEKLLSNNMLRKKLIMSGFKQAKNFSWEKCAKETLKLYEETNLNHNKR